MTSHDGVACGEDTDPVASAGMPEATATLGPSGPLRRQSVVVKTPTVATLTLVNGEDLQIPISRLVEDDAAYVKAWTEAA